MTNNRGSLNVAWAGYKRPFDLCIIAVAGALLLPFWLILWASVPLAIWLEDRGRVFYVQRRVGRGGRHFRLFKFRTMVEDAEGATGPVWATTQDPRLTRVGRVLRRFHLDEIPQLLNVLRGDMSLVGPRPERPELMQRIERQVPDFEQRLKVRPGIAGLAQVQVGYHAEPHIKLRYDKLYMATMKPLLDMKLLLLGVWYAFVKPFQNRAPAEVKAMHWLYGIEAPEAANSWTRLANGAGLAESTEQATANGSAAPLVNGAPKAERQARTQPAQFASAQLSEKSAIR